MTIRARKPRTPVKKVNPKRRAKGFARAYHSEERVLFVKGLMCCVCTVEGFTENAHIEGDGAGRKAHYTKIVPLCGSRYGYLGHHNWLHAKGREEFEARFDIDLDQEAAETEALWASSVLED